MIVRLRLPNVRLRATHASESQHVVVVLRYVVGLTGPLLRNHAAALAAGTAGQCTRLRVSLAHVSHGASADRVRRRRDETRCLRNVIRLGKVYYPVGC